MVRYPEIFNREEGLGRSQRRPPLHIAPMAAQIRCGLRFERSTQHLHKGNEHGKRTNDEDDVIEKVGLGQRLAQ